MTTITVTHSALRRVPARGWPTLAVLVAALLWSYWPTLSELAALWRTDDDYSVGQLVPLAALLLIWQKRGALQSLPLRPHAAGAVVLAASQALRLAGVYYAYASAERLALALAVAGAVLLIGGAAWFRRLAWIQLFLLLMFPLPRRVHELVSTPLQNWATALGAGGLELLGFYVRRAGNVLHLSEQTSVLVAEACSGLRLLTAFVFTAALVAFVVHRPAWQKVLLLLSSMPIAVLANAARVLATSVVVYWSRNTMLEHQFHDLAGLLMMPLALLLLVGELKFLALLTQPSARHARLKPARGHRPAAAHESCPP